MTIDIESLRRDLQEDSYAAYYGGGYGAALIEAMDPDSANDEDVLNSARNHGIDPSRYETF